jgi:hypothetical protein
MKLILIQFFSNKLPFHSSLVSSAPYSEIYSIYVVPVMPRDQLSHPLKMLAEF